MKGYVEACLPCKKAKQKSHASYGLLRSIEIPEYKFQVITLDFIVDLPPSKLLGQVYDTILVIVDKLTKLVRYVPVRKKLDAIALA